MVILNPSQYQVALAAHGHGETVEAEGMPSPRRPWTLFKVERFEPVAADAVAVDWLMRPD